MKREYFLILGIIVVLIIVGIVFSGYIQQQFIGGEPAIAKYPTIDLEATVVSLSPDTNIECENECPGYQYPKDTGVIEINKIISIDNPNNWELKGIEEDGEITAQFHYSSRPAKIRMIPALNKLQRLIKPETLVSHVPTFAKPIPKEDGYFIYSIESTLVDEETETILPGLKVDSKFRATISYSSPGMISVSQYEIIA